MEPKIANKYKICRKIGEGSFGGIYLGLAITSGEEVAIMFEPSKKDSKLVYESRIYRTLQEGSGIPKLYYNGAEADFNILVLELLGPSLGTLKNYCRQSFSLKTVVMLAEQMISRVEFMHSHYYLHRDIKPENFLIGIGKKANILHLIDFGLSKKFVEKYNRHISFKEGKKLVGTARYVSINTHAGLEQSRRDDLEALGYVFVYLLKGKLPWQGLPGITKEDKYRNIMKKKASTTLEELCLGFPSEFIIFINYCRTLRFEEKPDYSYLRRLFKELLARENLVNDSLFDWLLPRNGQLKVRNSIKTK